MPELPEVETVRRGLQPVMEGARIVKAEARRADLRFPFQPDFVARLQGQTVTGLGRRAKYLMADLASGDVLLMHLGMSGSFRVIKKEDEVAPDEFQAIDHNPGLLDLDVEPLHQPTQVGLTQRQLRVQPTRHRQLA